MEFRKQHKRIGLATYSIPENDLLLTGSSSPMANGSGNVDSIKQEQLNNRTTDAQTMMHILKANIGTGVLAMPNAFKNVGLWLGFILVPIIGAICIHCMNILIASHNHLCDRFNYESLDYDQVAALGLACGPKLARRLAKWAHLVVTTFLIFTQLGFCCVYIMFVVENVQVAILNLFKIEYSTTTYLLIIFPIIGLTSCTSNLKHLARISTLANVLQLTGMGLIFFDLLQFHTYSDQLSHEQANNGNNNNSTSTTISSNSNNQVHVNQLISDDIYNGLPLFFSTAVYAFEGIGVVLPLIKEMKHPSRISGLNGVLNSSMSMVALLYMAIGFFGYSKYGQFVQGSITLNLPETTTNELVRIIFALAIGLSYSLQFYVPWTIMWPHIDEALFYSYRPREPRDKLDILNRLSAENEWALDSDSVAGTATGAGDDSSQQQMDEEQQRQLSFAHDNHSTASTFGTSYTMSTYLQPQMAAATNRARRINLSSSNNGSTTTTAFNQYGSVSLSIKLSAPSTTTTTTTTTTTKQQVALQPQQRRRNRLDDVTEQVLAEDCIPEVQWRPPPRSMRGKRKLVRYTVILVSVSFTFVAAALIPRLDLFISLIGALASSCLAIIFPAIIQLCTFWQPQEEQQPQQRKELAHSSGNSSPTPAGQCGLSFGFFVAKNLLLIVFGILGLITGTWISISQLSSAYLDLSDAV